MTLRPARAIARTAPRGDDGYTILEVLVVLAIIGMIMGIVAPRVLSYLSDSKTKAAAIQVESLTGSLDLFFMDAGRYPSTQEGLTALVEKPAGVARWNGPYLRTNGLPSDPWGHPYVYRAPGAHGAYEVLSLGPAGVEGDAGNIQSAAR